MYFCRNGGEPNSPILTQICGNTETPQNPIRSMSNQLWIESHLQGSGNTFSFNANADQAGCGGTLHGEHGNITAPLDDNGKYRNGIRCTWDIETQPGYIIKVNFYGRFDIEKEDNCGNDYIMVCNNFCIHKMVYYVLYPAEMHKKLRLYFM